LSPWWWSRYVPPKLPPLPPPPPPPPPPLSFLILHTVGRTPRTRNQPVSRTLPKQDNRNTDIHVHSGIRIHDPSLREVKGTSYPIPCGRCNRQILIRERNIYSTR
jgi:hypothetical protein